MELPENKLIILFDGVCNLCNNTVQFILRRDKKDRFRFATLQSDLGKELVRERGIDSDKVDSIILIEPGIAYYIESEAALKIGKEFGGVWRLLAIFDWVPPKIRDPLYRLVARNRYKWFGKKDQCMVPTPDLLNRFL